MERHNANGLAVAQFLSSHPNVLCVFYPGLDSHPQHALACKQMRGFSSMVCFEVKGGANAGFKLLNSFKLLLVAVSLGGIHTLITHPYSTVSSILKTEEAKRNSGVSPGLMRMSVGLEVCSILLSG